MMKIQYKNIVILSFLLLVTALSSCSESELDKVNEDKNHVTDVNAEFIIPNIETASASNIVGGDLSTYAGIYVEHETGTDGGSQMYGAQARTGQPTSSSTYNNQWMDIYRNITYCRIVVAKSEAAGNHLMKGIGEVLLAYNSAVLTDSWGDVPYSEAAQVQLGNRASKIDKQEDIYKTIDTLLDDALVDLQSTEVGKNPLRQDFVYNGDAKKWVKFVYGLKARYAMRRLGRSADKDADLRSIIANCNKSFTSVTDQAACAIYSASNLNPLFDYQFSRDGLSSSRSLADKLIKRHDPRLTRAYYDSKTRTHQTIASNDDLKSFAPIDKPSHEQSVFTCSTYGFAQTAPILFLSYHELLFLKAEAQARLGLPEAKATLKAAVVAGMANSEYSIETAAIAPNVSPALSPNAPAITPAQTKAWFDADIASLYDADPIGEVMVQKYISQWGASGEALEAYNDIRRAKGMGEEYVKLDNPENLGSSPKFPLRFTYGGDEAISNLAVKKALGDGTYVYSHPVWWAGGND